MSNLNAYPKETVELVEVQVTYSGARVPKAELEFSVVPDGDAPGVWTPATEDNGMLGVWLDGTRAAGTWHIYAKHTPPDSPARPVLDVGTIELY